MKKDYEKSQQLIEVQIAAEVEYVGVVRTAIHEAIAIAGMPGEDADSVALALDEALANVIRHGYGGSCAKPIIVRVRKLLNEDGGVSGLELTVRDFGKQIDPTNIKGRDLSDIRPGGLGVHIIRSVMDEVEYSCPAEGGMQLRMTKHFDASKEHREAGQTEKR